MILPDDILRRLLHARSAAEYVVDLLVFRDLAQDADVWTKRCFDDFGIVDGDVAAYRRGTEFRKILNAPPRGTPFKILKIWATIKKSLSPEITDTFRKGIAQPPRQQESPFPLGMENERMLYETVWRVLDGQLMNPREEYRGLFGGFLFYGVTTTTVFLLPRGECIRETRRYRPFLQSMMPDCPDAVVFAKSHNRNEVRNGSKVYILTGKDNFSVWCSMQMIGHQGPPRKMGDSLVGWLEEYARRLETGIYREDLILPSRFSSKGLSLFPKCGPLCCRAVTNQVEVCASSIYIGPQIGWTYSVRLRLLPGPLQQCQLDSRAWAISVEGFPDEFVHGKGLIGKFPILVQGGWILNSESDPRQEYDHEVDGSLTEGLFIEGPFVYQSCSRQRGGAERGSFQGVLYFVPGTRKNPTGPPFEVTVAPFPLEPHGRYWY